MIDLSTVPLWVWAYLGIVIGIALRTIIPYIQQVQMDPNTIFEWKYIGTAFLSAFSNAIFLMPLYTIPEADYWQILFLAALFAYTTNELINRRVDKYMAIKKARGK